MGKRQYRYFQKDILSQKEQWQGQLLNVVLKNNTTYFGDCISIDATQMVLKDKLRIKHTFALVDILEIIAEKEAQY